jgi:hypothetical protein
MSVVEVVVDVEELPPRSPLMTTPVITPAWVMVVDVEVESVIEVVEVEVEEVLSSLSILINGRFWRDFPASVIEVVYSSSSFLTSSS